MAHGLLLKSLGAGYVGLRAPPCALLELNSCRRLGQWPALIPRGVQKGSVRIRRQCGNRRLIVKAVVDPWAPGAALDSQSIASSLFAGSLFPYLGFLYHITKSKTSPPMTLFGFYFLLAFVGATILSGLLFPPLCSWFWYNADDESQTSQEKVELLEQLKLSMNFSDVSSCLCKLYANPASVPAGIYAKIHYGTSLSNVDWLHGGAESLLTLTNLFIVFGLRGALRNAEENDKQVEVKVEEENVPYSK
ncbi:hypothetical protein AXG93_4193s1280 [Marchantia polymorpha subsp. ruderalis]|uniref:Uncharacterized protein n=1 Tax=Marchantia polymorpha subsp. ruderalis TaxID=1480154 RepID=A0A176W3V9_MARPO|nr:hypothetical protein AXG93_4193s1280 [Marchantia polymorpha subsp. ruderalis]